MTATAGTPAQAPPRGRRSPYQGIVPYGPADAEWFFGRDEWREIVVDNLQAYRISVLYGESGVGKSSLLNAAVLPRLHEAARRDLADRGACDLVAVSFASWSETDPLGALKEAIAAAHAELSPGLAAELPGGTLAEQAAAWCERTDGGLFLVLDQFEELFLYHAHDGAGRDFERELTEVLRRRDVPANVLISIREDALARLDRLQARVPGLLDNLLRVEHLELDAARSAIERPLENWNDVEGPAVAIEPALVDEILVQVEAGKLLVAGAGGAGRVRSGDEQGRVEAPFLQLVLTRIWEVEREAGSTVLRLATLTRLGGAERIVRTHLDQVLASLSRRERDVAAKAFRFLVTPSGTKIAHRPPDLAEYAEVPEERLTPVLNALSGEARILRPVSGGAYEIYHDVLSAAILDWRRRYEESKRSSLLAQRAFLGAVAGLAAVLIVAWYGHVLDRWERRTVDARFALRDARPADDVAVVGIDERTLAARGWPLPRRLHGQVIDRIAEAHPRAIAVDIQFTQQSDPADDNALIEAVGRAGNVVLGTTNVDTKGGTSILGGDALLQQIGARPGHSLVPAASDGVVRRVPYQVNGLKSLGIVAAEIATGAEVPRPASSQPLIDFAGKPGTVDTYSYADVLGGRVPSSAFRDRIVVIGATAPALQDVQDTSAATDEPMSGAEIQANVAQTAVRGFPLDGWRWLAIPVILVLALLVPLASLRVGVVACLALAVGAAALYLLALQLAFDHDVVLPAIYAVLALVLTTVLSVARRLRDARRRRTARVAVP